MSEPRPSLPVRVLKALLRRFGEEEITRAVPARLARQKPAFVPEEAPWRGWRIERDGEALAIRRSDTRWERTLPDGEPDPHAPALHFLRPLALGGFGFDYRLDAVLVPTPEGLVLRGHISTRGFRRSLMLSLFFLVGVAYPTVMLLAFAGSGLLAMAAAWPHPGAIAVELALTLASLGFGLAMTMVLVGLLLGMAALMRRQGEAERARLLAFLARLVEQAAGPRRR